MTNLIVRLRQIVIREATRIFKMGGTDEGKNKRKRDGSGEWLTMEKKTKGGSS